MLLQAVLSLLVGPERWQPPVFELRSHILSRHHIYLTIFLYVLILSRLFQTVCKDFENDVNAYLDSSRPRLRAAPPVRRATVMEGYYCYSRSSSHSVSFLNLILLLQHVRKR